MPVTNAPPLTDLQEIASQIRRRLLVSDGDSLAFSFNTLNERASPATSSLDMTLTLDLWRLTPAAVDRFKEEGGDLAKLATPSGRFHHQVKLDGDATAFARSGYSSGKEGERWLVDEIYVSPLAVQLEEVYESSKKLFPGDNFLARLLTAPAYKVEALWFVNRADAENGVETGGDLLIVDAPGGQARLEPHQRINSTEFLEILRNMPVGLGIKAKAGSDETPGPLNFLSSSSDLKITASQKESNEMATKKAASKSRTGRSSGGRGSGSTKGSKLSGGGSGGPKLGGVIGEELRALIEKARDALDAVLKTGVKLSGGGSGGPKLGSVVTKTEESIVEKARGILDKALKARSKTKTSGRKGTLSGGGSGGSKLGRAGSGKAGRKSSGKGSKLSGGGSGGPRLGSGGKKKR